MPNNNFSSSYRLNFLNLNNSLLNTNQNSHTLNKYFLKSSLLLKSLSFNLFEFNTYTHFNDANFSLNNTTDSITKIYFNYFLKDTHLLFKDYDLLDKKNLSILSYLSEPSSCANHLNFFNYFNQNFKLRNFTQIRFKNQHFAYSNDNFHYQLLSLINVDRFYLMDLNYLNIFPK
jgi:hypothetical protein